MSAPAELRRRTDSADGRAAGTDTVVARGPLILMAYALASIPDAARGAARIATPAGDYSARDAAALLRHWALTPRGE